MTARVLAPVEIVEAALPVTLNAPAAALPIVVTPPPVALMLAAPVTVMPPVPWIRPVPAVRPTLVTRPVAVMLVKVGLEEVAMSWIVLIVPALAVKLVLLN